MRFLLPLPLPASLHSAIDRSRRHLCRISYRRTFSTAPQLIYLSWSRDGGAALPRLRQHCVEGYAKDSQGVAPD